MILLEKLIYCDSRGREWYAPQASIVDGASIPRFLWRAIGSPFVGKYRMASVMHDVYCTNKSVASPLVHEMFYDAMLTDGVCPLKAKIMWFAVNSFGPRFGARFI